MQNYVRSAQFLANLCQIMAEFVNKLTVVGLSVKSPKGKAVMNKFNESQNKVFVELWSSLVLWSFAKRHNTNMYSSRITFIDFINISFCYEREHH